MDDNDHRSAYASQAGSAAGAGLTVPDAGAGGAGHLGPEEEALHIQAAAVAAQQGALTREEMRLEKRCRELAQQEQQLGEHFQQKLARLEKLRNEVRQAHATLQKERTAYETRVAQVLHDLAADRRGLADRDRQVQAEREHLRRLHRRLSGRWRRHWNAERAVLGKREREIDRCGERARQERSRLDQELQKLAQEQARFSAQSTLGRRYLRSERERLRKLQAELDQRETLLGQKEAAAAEEAGRLALEKHRWQEQQAARGREAEGLETRIANYRSKLAELEQQTEQRSADQGSEANREINSTPSPLVSDPPPLSPVSHAEQPPAAYEDASAGRLASLERLAGEVADQRRCLAEECLRLVRQREQWLSESQAAAADLDQLSKRLQMAEQALVQREQAVQHAERTVQQKFEALTQAQKRLEGWKALLAARAGAWEGERQRQVAELQSRETVVQARLAALSRLSAVWQERRRRLVLALRAQRAACEELRRQYAFWSGQWSSRVHALEQQQRGLTQRSLALDQYELEQVQRALDPAAMERRLKELRLRSAALSASELRHLAHERSRLEAETAILERRLQQLHEQEQRTLAFEAELAIKLSTWEKEQEARQAEQAHREQELDNLRRERLRQDGQLELLRGEVERLARLLGDEQDPSPLRLGQAA